MQTEIGISIEKAVALLTQNELVAIPTETVYGLAGNALSEVAVAKIYAAKNRPSFNPLILHVKDVASLHEYAQVDAVSELLANAFMPGPLTLLLPKKSTVPDITTAGSKKVAIRVPNHPMTLSLLQSLPFPLAAPSANASGYISPTTAEHVLEGLAGKIPYILNGGATTVGVESTICEVVGDKIILHRAGGITAADLEAASGLKVEFTSQHSNPETPGQLKSHYAPKTPLFMGNVAELIKANEGKKTAVISLHNNYEGANNFILSTTGNLAEAANKLFATLRAIDASGFDIILTEQFPNEGIGLAINDRLSRAQSVYKR